MIECFSRKMGYDFDLHEFCQNIRANKPPYECPVASCRKIYKSFIGIQFHLFNYDHDNPHNTPGSGGGSQAGTLRRWNSTTSADTLKTRETTTIREGLTYAESQKMVEIDVEEKIFRINISQPIKLVDKTVYEASLPPKAEATSAPPEIPTHNPLRTPVSSRIHPFHKGHKGHKSPKIQPPTPVTPLPQPEEKKKTLPEPQFSLLPNYSISDAPIKEDGGAYIRFIEKTAEELDEEVEYDMDEEDAAWLQIINEKRENDGWSQVTMCSFELLMDRLEKESYFQMQNNSHGPLIDDDAVCCICMDGECQNSNVILFCDMCNLAVHQECYGVPYIPEGQWLCRRCLQSPSHAVDCALCPNKGGAFKQTDDARWAHVVCALWIPEVCFANTVFLEPIDSIENIPPARWKLSCYICKQRGVGACIQCHRTNCYTAFHVTCAQQAGLHMKMDTVRETLPSGMSVTVRKTAYCDVHTPTDSEQRPLPVQSPVVLTPLPPPPESSPEWAKKAEVKAQSRIKMRKARKLLAEKRSAVPIVSIPTIPPERVQQIASLVSFSKKNQFIQRLMAYWTLKRQSRHGVPLLRRLQAAHPNRREDRKGEDKKQELRGELKYWQRLRQDLERARLLCELIRKREKTKRESVRIYERQLFLQLHPFVFFLRQVIQSLYLLDLANIFSEPVDTTEVHDYLNVITTPMDISTMQSKVENLHYISFAPFQTDFELMIANCMTYNNKDTMFYRAAVKLRDQGGALMRQARRDMEAIGFDEETGLLQPEKPKGKQIQDKVIVQELEKFLLDCPWESLPLNEQLPVLLEAHDKALALGVTRIRKAKAIKTEIKKVRRKIALEAREEEEEEEEENNDKEAADTSDEDVEPSPPKRRAPVSPPPTKRTKFHSILPSSAKTRQTSSSPPPVKKRPVSPSLNKKRAYKKRSQSPTVLSTKKRHASPSPLSPKKRSTSPTTLSSKKRPLSPTTMAPKKRSLSPSTLSTKKRPPSPSTTSTKKRPLSPTTMSTKKRPSSPTTLSNKKVPSSSNVTSSKKRPVSPSVISSKKIPVSPTSGSSKKRPASPLPTNKKHHLSLQSMTKKQVVSPSVPKRGPQSPSPQPASKKRPTRSPTPQSTGKKRPARSPSPQSPSKKRPASPTISKRRPRSPSPQPASKKRPASPSVPKRRPRSPSPQPASKKRPASPSPPKKHPRSPSPLPKKKESSPPPSTIKRKASSPPPLKKKAPSPPPSPSPPKKRVPSPPKRADEVVVEISPSKRVGRKPSVVKEKKEEKMEEKKEEVQTTSGVNRRTAVLFTKKSVNVMKKPLPIVTPKRPAGRGVRKVSEEGGPCMGVVKRGRSISQTEAPPPSVSPIPPPITNTPITLPTHQDSFKVYRERGELATVESDSDSVSGEESSLLDSSSDSDSSDGSSGSHSGSHSSRDERHSMIPLEPLDLVWAKCRGYPWYPALIINPNMPKTGYFHNGVPIPVPPDDVLTLGKNYTHPVFLVLFFDTKRTWQWLPRSKLEPLGVDSGLDKAKLVESRKATERKAVKKAYEEAILHRCRVTGEGLTAGPEEVQQTTQENT